MADEETQEPQPSIQHDDEARDLETIIYRGKKIAEMMATDGWKMVIDDLTARRETLLRSLLKEISPDQVGNIATIQAGINAIDYILEWTDGVVNAMRSAYQHRSSETVDDKERAG